MLHTTHEYECNSHDPLHHYHRMRKSLNHFVFTGGVMVIGIWELGKRAYIRASLMAYVANTFFLRGLAPNLCHATYI